MAKITLTDITGGFGAAAQHNTNNTLLEAAIENSLSRDGTTPNNMEAVLDMNSFRIINLADGVDPQDAATKTQLDAVIAAGLPVQTGWGGGFLTTNGSVTSWTLSGAHPTTKTDVPVTGGTLALTNAEAKYVAFDVEGVLASNQTITVPATQESAHLYVIDNKTSGAFTLQFGVVGGASVTVPQGHRYIMYSSGLNMEGITAIGGGGVVNDVFGRVGSIIAVAGDYDTDEVTEATNLYYTEGRVSANADVAANTSARHSHANKALLDTYTQTEVDIADAISKEHTHSNKATLDNITAPYTTAEETKLAGIETAADVTDSANVDAAGAVMNSDTSTAPMGFVIDEDTLVSNLDTKVPTQQSVKAYVDAAIVSSVTYKGSYNAATNTPDLDTSPSGVLAGDMYTVTVAGTFFTTGVEVGDVLIAEADNATTEAEWTVVNKNLDAASIKTAYESNADTNAFTDAEQTKLGTVESGATADQSDAEIKTAYENNADTNEFSDAEQTKLAGIETSATADQTAGEIKTAYESNADTNEFSDAEQTKLAGIETAATADQAWGDIAGTLSNQTDLQTELDALHPDGKVDHTVTGGTLALTDAQAQFVAFDIDGALTSNQLITVPAGAINAHLYVIDNKTTGAYTLQFGVVAGDSVTIPQGHRYIMYSSGLNMEGITAVGGGGVVADVFGRTGSVIAVAGDYDTDEVTEATNLYYTDARVTANASVAANTAKNSYPSADATKLAGIETGATADQTNAQIKTAYEANADTNEFSNAEQTKLAGIETAATADQTGNEIKTAYEAEANTNAYTDAEKTKLTGIETAADVTDATNVEAAGAVMDADVGVSVQAYDADIPTVVMSQAEAEAGVSTANRTTTPLRQAQAIAALAAGGGATGGGTDKVFVENEDVVTTDYTLTTNNNAHSVGPITINTGITVTVPAGATWVVS